MEQHPEKESSQPSQATTDIKFELMQFAKTEMHVVKEDIREMLRADIEECKTDIKKRNSRIMKIAALIVSFTIGLNIFAWFRVAKVLNDKVEQTLNKEVQSIKQKISDRLDKEFETERIRELIGERAKEFTEKQAKNYISEKVNEKIKPFYDEMSGEFGKIRSQTLKESSSFRSYLDETKENFKKEYNTLSVTVSVLDQRNKLMSLSDKAISDGSREALDKLYEFAQKTEQQDLRKIATSEILRVKSFYLSGSRIIGTHLFYNMPPRFQRTDDEIPTSILISSFLKGSDVWQWRARAAELLGTRRERGVPDALLEACHDKSLDVIKASLHSFKLITEFVGTDIFGCDEAKQWWRENKSEKEKNLKAHEDLK